MLISDRVFVEAARLLEHLEHVCVVTRAAVEAHARARRRTAA